MFLEHRLDLRRGDVPAVLMTSATAVRRESPVVSGRQVAGMEEAARRTRAGFS
jgi:hypothetical protein